MVLLMKMEKYSVKIGLGSFAVSTKSINTKNMCKIIIFVNFNKISVK